MGFNLLASAAHLVQGESGKLPVQLRSAGRQFAKKRFQYFENLAQIIEASGGKTTYLSIFEKEAQRYASLPRGKLAAYWVERMHDNGARISETWAGCVPADELAVFAVAEKRGRGAMEAALRDVARVGATIEKARKAFFATILIASLGLLIATLMLLAMPFFFKPFFVQSFGFIPPEFYGPQTRRYYAMADFIGAVWWLVLPALVAGACWIAWALPNWTGRYREMCDERLTIFRLYRDFKGALFLATFASLTRSSGAEVTNQRNALLMMEPQVQPWLRWKIRKMLTRMDDRGAADASVFDVGVVDREIYYRIADIFEARGLSEGLSIAGRESEDKAVSSIAVRGNALRALMLGGGLMTVISLLLWVYAVVFEFKGAIGTWANS